MSHNARFRFAPEILRRLGEELNPSVDQGIIELVKNAYDADAQTVTVAIDTGGSGRVEIFDDGDGMGEDQIINGWLVLGSSNKDTAVRTARNRVPAGNKGLGRLAALRLGSRAELTSVQRGSGQQTKVVLDWREFDSARTVDEVIIPIETTQTDEPGGTRIVVTSLKRKIGRMDVKRVARSMVLLADPFADAETDFRPILRSPEFGDLEKLVDERYFEDASYHLVAQVVGGKAKASVLDWRGRVLFETTRDSALTETTYKVPDTTFELWAFTLNASNFVSRTSSVAEVREWLTLFGGVHIYLNKLRVNPYGNAGNDWLDMNLARVRSPEERPSTNTSIGRMRIDDASGSLQEKTDRSGFVENESFEELRRFGHDALEWMARERLAVAEARRRAARKETMSSTTGERSAVSEQIARLDSPSQREQLDRAFRSYDSAREKEVRVLRKEVQLYRTLSTAGITTATFAHEASGNTVKTIELATTAIEYRAKKVLAADQYAGVIEKSVSAIRKATRSIGVLAQATLRLVDGDKRRVGRVDLNDVITEVLDTYRPFLEGRNVTVETNIASDRSFVQGSAAALESVLANLLNNSLSVFEQAEVAERKVRIRTEMSPGGWLLTVTDNGPGIQNISLKDIWLPGESRRPGGTGLGLTIVKDAVADLGGAIVAHATSDLGGAQFDIQLPTLNKEKS